MFFSFTSSDSTPPSKSGFLKVERIKNSYTLTKKVWKRGSVQQNKAGRSRLIQINMYGPKRAAVYTSKSMRIIVKGLSDNSAVGTALFSLILSTACLSATMLYSAINRPFTFDSLILPN